MVAFVSIESKCITSRCASVSLNFISGPMTPFSLLRISLERACVCVCAQTCPIHAGHPNVGGNAIREGRCAAMTVVAFFYGVNATISSTASTAATNGAAVRASPYSHSPSSSSSFRTLVLTMTNVS